MSLVSLVVKDRKRKNGKLLAHIKGESRGRRLGVQLDAGALVGNQDRRVFLSMICVSFICVGASLRLDIGTISL